MRNPSQTGDPRRSTTNEDAHKSGTSEIDKDVQIFMKKKRAEMKSGALKKKIDPFTQKALGHHIYRRERHSISQLKRLSKINRKEQERKDVAIGVDY